jgi:DNA helicase IV
VLAVTDPGIDPPRSVRRSGATPRFARTDREHLVAAVLDHVERLRSEIGEGTIAVIAPERLNAALREPLGARPGTVATLDAPVGLFTAVEAKGLEFDAVVVVEPAEVAGPTQTGLRGLYVALTRATRFLTVVHSGALPPGLRSPA